MLRRIAMTLAIAIVASAFARRFLFHGTTLAEVLLGAGVVLALASYAIYELFENTIKSATFYKNRQRMIEGISRVVDDVFSLLGSIGLAVGLFIFEPPHLWLAIGRLFIIGVALIGIVAFSRRLWIRFSRGNMRDDAPRCT